MISLAPRARAQQSEARKLNLSDFDTPIFRKPK